MPRPARVSALAALVASDSEPDLDHFDAAEIQAARQTQASASTVKRGRGRPPNANKVVNKVVKPATILTTSTARSGLQKATGANVAPKPTPTTKSAPPPPARATRQAKKRTAAPGSPDADSPSDPESTEKTTAALPSPKKTARRGRPPGNRSSNASQIVGASAAKPRGQFPTRHAISSPDEVQDTQLGDQMNLDAAEQENILATGAAVGAEAMDSLQGMAEYDSNDVALRRRLGDLSKKYESLELRHRDLREVGIKDAEENYERLRKQADDKSAAANHLITELRRELAAESVTAKQAEQLQSQTEAYQEQIADLESIIAKLNGTISEARTEIKTLSTKLAASRSADAHVTVPGSVIKGSSAAQRAAQAGAAQLAQAKEDFYADLTGLLIRDVRQDETKDVFDCIQTGRNGTLHFKLAFDKTDTLDDDTTYTPQMDPSRDQDLIEVLPDYLFDELKFRREGVNKFFMRIHRSLTEKHTD